MISVGAPAWKMHAGQHRAFLSPARFKVVPAGRRWGKSELGVMERVARARDRHLRGVKGVSWVVGPTYKVLRPIWRKFMRLSPRQWVTRVYGTDRAPDAIEFGNVRIEFKSAEIPENLVAEGLLDCWIDECGIIKEQVWSESIRPTLMDHVAPATFTGTPKGRNWFYRMYLRGLDPEDRDVAAFGGPSYENPFLALSEIADMRRDMSELVFRQEILAEFLTDDGAVFRQVRQRMRRPGDPPLGPTAGYGIDLAKHADFTVIVGLDASGRVTEFERFNRVSWTLQKERIKARCGRALPVVIDATGVGDPILDDLLSAGLNVQGYKISNASKIHLIEALTIAFDESRITLPDEPVLLNELEAFEYEISKTGAVRYSAPEGVHDDCVIALALAWQAVNRYGSIGIAI